LKILHKFNSWILHLQLSPKIIKISQLNFYLRYTKSNLGNCYTVRVISITAASEQHKLSRNK